MNDLPAGFLLEVALRSFIMFLVILLAMRASGKRGIKQLSVLELVLIIGLGSAAGDPMFYEDVGILPAITVFAVIIALYFAITQLSDHLQPVERLLQGEPTYVIADGKIIIEHFKKLDLSREELFSELRVLHIEHLGQVRTALVETSGEFSVLFFTDEDVKPGLPIFPAPLSQKMSVLSESGAFACGDCGAIQELKEGTEYACPFCACTEWVKPIDTKRTG